MRLLQASRISEELHPWRRVSLRENVIVGANRETCLRPQHGVGKKKKAPWEFLNTSLPSQRRDMKIYYLYAENPKGKINFKCFLVKITLGTWQMQRENYSNPSRFQSAKYDHIKNYQKHKNKPPGKDEQKSKDFDPK